MKKKFILILLILSLTILFPFFYIEEIRSILRTKLPLEIKIKFKETVFGKEYMEEIEYLKKTGYNKRIFPDTQFDILEVKKYLIDDLDILEQSHYDKIKNTRSNRYRFYLEKIKNDIIIATVSGSIRVVKDLDFENIINIQTNLDIFEDKLIMDSKVIDGYLYLSLNANQDAEKKNCKYFYVVKAKYDEKFLDFSNFYESDECALNNYGGRISQGKISEKNGLILSTGATETEANLAQDDKSHMGKFLFFDFKDPEPQIISKGHRNPQGLYAEGNLILSTEHGPYGGDEINKIELGKNYGWPIVSLGDSYEFENLGSEERQKKLDYKYKKDHQADGYTDPIFTYVPSIGISEIIKVPGEFSKYWQNNFLIASLNGGSLYRVSFDKNFNKIIYSEQIEILDRIRDIIYIPQIKSFALSLEDHGEIWLLKSKK